MNRAAHQEGLFEPTQLFAVRAIGQNTLQIAFDTPIDEIERAVKQIV